MSLPAGPWRYLFADRELIQGPAQITRTFPLDEYPVFIREGAIVPLKVTRPYTGFGDNESGAYTTWLIYPRGKNEFTLWHPETHPAPDTTTVKVDSGESLRFEFSGKREPHILRIAASEKPVAVALDGKELPEGEAWWFEPQAAKLIIKTRDYTEGRYEIRRRRK